MAVFDEQALLADVIARWGEHGAHADLLKSILAKTERLCSAGDALAVRAFKGGGDLAELLSAVAAWEETRRG